MRREEVLRNHWFFSQEVGKEEALASDFQRENWQAIQVPHDWSIYNDFDQYSPAQNEGGQLNGGQAWYRTQFYLEEDASLVSVHLLFDGVYMNAQVYVNGQVLGYCPNGYTPFSYDITPYLRNDGTANQLAVFVENQQPSSRWYSGSGIYREVKLLITDAVHLDLYGINIASPKLKEQRQSWVETQLESKVSNDGPQSVSVYLEQSIWYDGQQVSDWQATDSVVIEAGDKHHFQQAISIFQPLLWDIDHPHLYQLKTRIYKNGILVDEEEESFGYRYMDWQAEKGFFLNGRWLKIHGVCLHHDYGALGAVENRSAAERRLRQMKEMGVNAIRITHNPASSILLDLAAKMGLHAEKTQLEPDGQDLLYLYFDVLDKDGNWVPTASNQLHFEIEGPARIVGVDNGRQASRERYQAQKNGRFKRKVFHGRGVVLVQSLEQVGQVRVKASARGIEPASFDLLVGEALAFQPVKNKCLFEIRVDNKDSLQEGHSPAIGLYPQTVDNPVNKVGNSEVIWETSGSAHAIIKQGVLHCLSAGDLAIRAIYQGKTYQMHLQVAENTSLGQAVSVRPLRLYTAKGTYPQLPSSVLVDYESGGVKRIKVVWEAIAEEDIASFHEFTVSGTVEGNLIKSSLWQ